MSHQRYAVVDVETTGLRADYDRVVDLAIVTLDRPGEVVDTFTTMVRPGDGRPLSHTALEGAPGFTDISDSVSSRLAGVIVAGFNVAFDVRFLEAEFERAQRRAPHLVVLDVRELARLVLGAEGSMVAICNDFDVPLVGTHTALSDAETAAGLLTYLLDLADEVGVDAVEATHSRAASQPPRAPRIGSGGSARPNCLAGSRAPRAGSGSADNDLVRRRHRRRARASESARAPRRPWGRRASPTADARADRER